MDDQDRAASLPERRRLAHTASWLVLGIVVLIGAVATGVAWIQENRSAADREQVAMDTAAQAVEEAAGTSAAALGGGAVLVDRDGTISGDRLSTFARDVAKVSALQAIGIVEVVPGSGRSAVEERLGHGIFRIDGASIAAAAPADEYWVVTRVVPEGHLTSMLTGFDVLSDPLSRGTARDAARTGEARLTQPVVLSAEATREMGVGSGPITLVFVIKPLYSAGSTPADPGVDPGDELSGFLVSAVGAGQLADVLDRQVPEGVDYRVLDGTTMLFGRGQPTDGLSDELAVMGRTWRIELADSRPVDHSFSLLVGGVTLVLLVVLAVVVTRDRRRQRQLRRVDASVRGTAELARRLSAALAVPDVVRVVEESVAPLVGATAVLVLVLDEAARTLVLHPDARPSPRSAPLLSVHWQLDAEPWSEATHGEVVVVPTLAAPPADMPAALVTELRAQDVGSLAMLPIDLGAGVDTVVVVVWPGTAPSDGLTRSTLDTVGELCEQALARAGTTDRNTRRSGALASFAEELARCDSVAEVSEAVLRSGWQPVQATAISLGLIDRSAGVLRVDHGATVAEQVSNRYAAPALDEPLAFTDAARTGRPVLLGSFQEYQRRYPGTDPANALMGAGARAAMPLAVDDELIGAVAFAWAQDRTFDEALLFSLTTIAELAAQAVHRVRLMGLHRIDADRSRQLATVAQQLTPMQDGPQLARYVVDDAVAVTGAQAAALVVHDGLGWERTASSGLSEHPELAAELLGERDGRKGRIAAAVATGADLSASTSDALPSDAADPDGDPAVRAGFATSATLALRDRDGAPLGGLWLGWRSAAPVDEDLRDVVRTLAGMTAQSVARCLLTEQLRADADRNERLATFARRLANVTDVDELCRAVIEEGGGTVGAAVANLGLVDESGERLLVTPNPFFDADERELLSDRRMSDPLPGVDAVRRHEPVLLRSPDEAQERYPGPIADAMVRHGLTSSAHFPLLDAKGTAIGCIGFGWQYHQPFRPTKLARLRTIAELCTQTLERARLADAEHRLVESIHRRVVGRTVTVDELAVATRYLPATEEVGMGGDWYDTIVLDQHRIAVVVGDVTGHGISAVADMLELRAAIRALLQNGVPEEDVFSKVSDSWLDSTSSLATACVSIVDVERATLRHVSAGHIPALVRTPDGEVHVVAGGRQPLLGVPGRPTEPDEVPFPPGSVVVMCSDGLIERRDRSIDESIAELGRVLAGADADAGRVEELADLILHRSLTREEHDDDVALVVLGRKPGAGPGIPLVHEQTFPPRSESIRDARRFLTEVVATPSEDMVLAVSELVTNGVLHGNGPVTVRIEQSDGSVRLAVRDHGDGDPHQVDAAPADTHGRGLAIVDTVASDWGVRRDGAAKWVWAAFDRS